MSLTNSDIAELTEFRRELHRWPEISGEEEQTAARIAGALAPFAPTEVRTGLGGHGVAAVFDSGAPGPTVLFRAELDGLPIAELPGPDWISQVAGKGHLCGHDGHMTMLLALGRLLSRRPVARGRVVLMFQPAEETGAGARAVTADPAFADLVPDWAFAIHVVPGLPARQVALRAGLTCCASQGLAIRLEGRTAHAAMPEDGVSPARAVAALIPSLSALGPGGPLDDDFRLVTVTHARIGEPTFGVAPGAALLHVTLRAANDDGMAALAAEARRLATVEAEAWGLQVAFETCDDFAATINDPEAVAVARRALDRLGLIHAEDGVPMRGSEDFGVFGRSARAAMLLVGAGEDRPALHNPDYDFDDDLLPLGPAIFETIARDLLR